MTRNKIMRLNLSFAGDFSRLFSLEMFEEGQFRARFVFLGEMKLFAICNLK